MLFNSKLQWTFIEQLITEFNETKKSITEIIDIDHIILGFVANILCNKSRNPLELEILGNLFDIIVELINSDKKSKYLDNKFSEWISQIKNNNTTENVVIRTKLLGAGNIVVKSLSTISVNHPLTEFILGVMVINKLRFMECGFVYTIGSFVKESNMVVNCKYTHNIEHPHILYEDLGDDTLFTLLPKLSQSSLIDIILQILLYLEMGQSILGFTHFDLHESNIMLAKTQTSQIIDIGPYEISIKSPKYRPIIIDYGMSCGVVNNNFIGTYGFEKYGILPYLVSGYDMYKLLILIISVIEKDNIKFGKRLRSFFGLYNDVDSLKISGDGDVQSIRGTYIPEGTYTLVANYTPLQLFFYIMKKVKRNKVFSVKQRSKYIGINFSNIYGIYNEVLDKDHSDEMIRYVWSGINNMSSYLMGKFNLYLLQEYRCKKKEACILEKFLSANKDSLYIQDLVILDKYVTIELPEQDVLSGAIIELLSINISDKDICNKIRVSEIVEDVIQYDVLLRPYFQMYYTILQLRDVGMLDTYLFSGWIDNFESSKYYRFYVDNWVLVQRGIRWRITLLHSIKQALFQTPKLYL